MPEEESWKIDIEHKVDRHDTAIDEDAKDIRKIKEQLALVIEALSTLEGLTYKSGHPSQAKPLERLKEIIARLSGDSR
jgi:hypothetical protein